MVGALRRTAVRTASTARKPSSRLRHRAANDSALWTGLNRPRLHDGVREMSTGDAWQGDPPGGLPAIAAWVERTGGVV